MTLIRFFLLFLLLGTWTSCSLAQPAAKTYVTKKTASGKAKKAFDKGMDYNFKQQNPEAIKEFEKAIKHAPNFITAHLQWAACYYEMKDFEKAEQGFEKVLAIDPLYNKKVFYTLALTEMKREKYKEATEHFINYVDANPKNKTLLNKAQRHIKDCNFIVHALKNPVPFNPKSLGSNVNTPGWEYLPSFTADGQTLIYTAADIKRTNEDFYISTKKGGVWQKGQPLKAINTAQNEGAQSISADGKFMVFTACNRKEGLGQCDLYFSEVRNNKWSEVTNMGSVINSRASDRQPSISANGNTLYFSSNRKGGKGGYDIWVSYRNNKGKWSTPQNMGEPVNTSGNESTPFIHADGQTLYFMSNGHPGMGQFDLYLSRLDSQQNWTTPNNLGYPINTKANDAALVISLDGKTAYFASDRDYKKQNESDRPTTDLYSFQLYEAARPIPVTYLKASVTDAAENNPLTASIELIDLATGKTQVASKADAKGEFLVCLPAGKNYALNVSNTGYLFHSEHFALSKSDQLDKPFLLNIALQPIPASSSNEPKLTETNSPVVLKNVFFDTGSTELKRESFGELNRLKDLLTSNPTLRIQINGHTDKVGSETDNQRLSEERAKAVYQYLTENGIQADRLRYRGFGETKPLNDHDSEMGRQENRRTEFEVIR